MLAEVAAAAVLVYVLVGWVFGDYVKMRDAARGPTCYRNLAEAPYE